MASVGGHVTLTVRVADMGRTRLLVWELRMLADRMHVMANPEAEALESLLDRYVDGGDDEHQGEPE